MSTGPVTIGRYQVRDRLGQGGMGVLYLALDPAIDRLVALKVLRVDNEEMRERFLREARLAARLQHPNIVTIYDVGSHEGQPFIAMEYISGETLAELIQRRAPLAVERKLELMLDACQGLAYAHRHGIVHRDIKPANLMVGRDAGVLKVLDFGIARGADSTLTQIGMLMGTPNYMSPEQVEGRTIDQRSDIFAVGLVFYELLAYRQAFRADTPHAVLHAVLHSHPTPLTNVAPDLDRGIGPIVDRAIAKDVNARYQDLEHLRLDLLKVIQRIKTERDQPTMLTPVPGGVHEAPQTPKRTPPPSADRLRLAERRAAQVAAHLETAEQAINAGDLDAAQAAAESAALLDQEDVRVTRMFDRIKAATDAREIANLLDTARQYLAQGHLTEANQAVVQALQIDSQQREAQTLKVQIERAVEEREQQRRREQAAARALQRVEECVQAGAFEGALRAIAEAAGYDPQNSTLQAARERVLALLDQRAHEEIAAARAEIAAGQHDRALHRLMAFTPWHTAVDQELKGLQAVMGEIARQRQEEEAARQRVEEERRAREAEEARRRAEEEARRKAAEEARRKAEEDARRQAEEEARRKAAEEAARKQAEEEAAKKAEDERRRKAYEEARRKVEEEKRLRAEAAAKKKAEEAARKKAADEEAARLAAEAEAKRQAEEAARAKAAEEARQRAAAVAAEEARKQAAAEAQKRAEEAARAKAAEEQRQRAAEEQRQRAAAAAAEEARKQAAADAQKRADEAARAKAAEEQRQRGAAEAQKRAEAEARQRAEAEARRKADEAVRAKAAEEQRQRAAAVATEEARRQAAAEAQKRAEAEARQRAETEAKRKADEAARAKAAEDQRQRAVAAAAEEARKQAAAEAQKRAEAEARQRAEAEAKRKAEEERARQTATRVAAIAAASSVADEATVVVPTMRQARPGAPSAPGAAAPGAGPGGGGMAPTSVMPVARPGPPPVPPPTPAVAVTPSTSGAADDEAFRKRLYIGAGIAAAILILILLGALIFRRPASDGGPSSKDGTGTGAIADAGKGADAGAGKAGDAGKAGAGGTTGTGTTGGTGDSTKNPPPPDGGAGAGAGGTTTTSPLTAAQLKDLNETIEHSRRHINRHQRNDALKAISEGIAKYPQDKTLPGLMLDLIKQVQSDADRAHTTALNAQANVKADAEFKRGEDNYRDGEEHRQKNQGPDAVRAFLAAEDHYLTATTRARQVADVGPRPGGTTGNTGGTGTQQGQGNPTDITKQGQTAGGQTGQGQPGQGQPGQGQTGQGQTGVGQTGQGQTGQGQTGQGQGQTGGREIVNPPPPPPPVNEKPAIQQTIDRLAAAYASLDTGQVAAVYPTISSDQLNRLKGVFRDVSSYIVTYNNCNIADQTPRATATCDSVRRITYKVQGPQQFGAKITFRLEKRGGTWVIVDQGSS